MFPDRQLGPHREWKAEVEYLDNIFQNGSAYTVGRVNGDHWLLYLTNPPDGIRGPHTSPNPPLSDPFPDYTLEILMSDLGTTAREPFCSSLSSSDDPRVHGISLSDRLGITKIFPSHLTNLDAYSFSPCGYSANALVKRGHDSDRIYPLGVDDMPSIAGAKEGYYTIHVTPEAGWSYASFECNVPSYSPQSTGTVPDLKSLVLRVVNIFQPGRLSLTLFISKQDNLADQGDNIETAQQAFKLALTGPGHIACCSILTPNCGQPVDTNKSSSKGYKRTDKINYEFEGYDLAFASFELME